MGKNVKTHSKLYPHFRYTNFFEKIDKLHRCKRLNQIKYYISDISGELLQSNETLKLFYDVILKLLCIRNQNINYNI